MNILVTGAKGFVGKNFVETLKTIRDGKNKVYNITDYEKINIMEYDIESTESELNDFCKTADIVFNFAGVNRPKDPKEFMNENFGFASKLLNTLKSHNNIAPIVLSSSIQASLKGRYAGSEYGKSKLAGEELFRNYSNETGAKVYIYRFPNLFGKWCKPNYNSAVATFCNNIANNLDIIVNDRNVELELLYIDDLIEEMIKVILNNANIKDDGFCYAEPTHKVTLGEIVDLLYSFKKSRETNMVPDCTENSFEKKLYATYLTYLGTDNFLYKLKMNQDARGSFTEILRTASSGQFSVNISKPGITKGQHWHHTKNEKFVVVSGHGLIQLRKIGTDENGDKYPIVEYRVSGEEISVIDMIPGYTHNIINLSESEDLVTFMWCNECFDPQKPDTFFEEV